MYCFGWNWHAHCHNNTLSLGTWQNWLQSLVGNSFTTKTITYPYTHNLLHIYIENFIVPWNANIGKHQNLWHVLKFKCSQMDIGI
jgi:hypothetical protein